MNEIYELLPVLKEYIWAGNKLKSYKNTTLSKISESWELSQLKDGHSMLLDHGQQKELFEVFKEKDFGSKLDFKKEFPLLIKLIDSASSLSIQVHPDDEYAARIEHCLGKTEMWIILEAEEDSYLYLGLKDTVSKEEFREKTSDDRILSLLNKVYVKPGDIFLIEPGTIHAIGKGITLIEIQQSSNITYRIYDFNRTDANGKKRELHLDKALDCISFSPYKVNNLKNTECIHTKFFNVYPISCEVVKHHKFNDSFAVISITKGEGTINNLPVKKYHSYIIKANTDIEVKGSLSYVISTL